MLPSFKELNDRLASKCAILAFFTLDGLYSRQQSDWKARETLQVEYPSCNIVFIRTIALPVVCCESVPQCNHFVDVGACVGGYQIRNHRSAGVVSVPRKSRQEIELGELGCQRMIVEQP